MDWSERYALGTTPWDMGRPHPELARRLASAELAASRRPSVLVPGCGNGHDARLLAESGCLVTALDLVSGLSAVVARSLEPYGGRFIAADALTYRAPHDVLFEHTFFCALPLEQRTRYGEMAAACVVPGGALHAVVFPANKPAELGGPPYGMTTEALAAALGSRFDLVSDTAVAPVEGRDQWTTRWATFQRVTDS